MPGWLFCQMQKIALFLSFRRASPICLLPRCRYTAREGER